MVPNIFSREIGIKQVILCKTQAKDTDNNTWTFTTKELTDYCHIYTCCEWTQYREKVLAKGDINRGNAKWNR